MPQDLPTILFPVNERIMILSSPLVNDLTGAVAQYLSASLQGKYRIYNLSDEEEYNIEQDLPNVISAGFIEGSPPPLELLIHICSAVDTYLSTDPHSKIILHCRTGGGRSCSVAACILLHSFNNGSIDTAGKAMDIVQLRRGIRCLTPSQQRYVYYYERLLRTDGAQIESHHLFQANVTTIPNASANIVRPGCAPYLVIHIIAKESGNSEHSPRAKLLYHALQSSSLAKIAVLSCDDDKNASLDIPKDGRGLILRGDFCVSICSEGRVLCQAWLNSAFIETGFIKLEKQAMDIAADDKRCRIFDEAFALEMVMQRVDDHDEVSRLQSQQLDEDFLANHGANNQLQPVPVRSLRLIERDV